MRTLCYGGSFNPVHNAHLACSLASARALRAERVLMIPSHQPVLKSRAYDLAAPEHRVAMLMLAIESAREQDQVAYDLDTVELERDGPTYTIDTAHALLARPGWSTPIDWLIGADQLLNLHRWHRFDELLRLVQFHVMLRPGYAIDWARVDPRAQPLGDRVVPIPQIDLSATQIRARIRAGQSVDGLVPPRVREYIRAHALYLPGNERVE
jgi:nicotinate-nucleotide adenylyltransferase